jgi:hypothetical protein
MGLNEFAGYAALAGAAWATGWTAAREGLRPEPFYLGVVTADLLGLSGALWIVATLTFISGLIVAYRMQETLAAAGVTGPE